MATQMSEIAVKAPARVNIIGEHTDYNGGFVLPTTTALYTRVVAVPRMDRAVEVHSTHYGETHSFRLDDIHRGEEVTWVEYVKGVAAELQADGIELTGATIEIASEIPVGGGLSSSASLELAIARALLAIAGVFVAAPDLAQLCQRAEHQYPRVRCGIMDQYTIACAEKDHAILLDCRSLAVEQVPIPAHARFIVTDSGVRHRLPDGQYNNRRDECMEAARILSSEVPGVTSLRDVDIRTLEAKRETLGETLYRRCRHVASENERVQAAVAALRGDDMATLGQQLNACQASLRDDFEVSCDEIETLVRIANECTGVLGSRMVGAGFGGCVLSLTSADEVDNAVAEISNDYNASFGRQPWIHVVEPSEPVREINST